MNFKSVLLVLIITLTVTSQVSAATISTTSQGGAWENGATWVGGVQPVNSDNIVISGPVLLSSTRTCNNLSVDSLGSLKNGTGAPYLIVNGDVHNEGTIANGTLYTLSLRVFGNLHNAGSWSNLNTYLAGTGPRNISQEEGADFETRISYSNGSGDLIVLSDVSISSLDLSGGQLVLQPGANFTLSGGLFQGSILAAGNEIRSIPNATFSDCILDDAVMTGNPLIGHNAIFTTRVSVMGTLLNAPGGGSVTFDGALVNYGLIDWQHSSFQEFEVTGDLENYGTIAIPILEFTGTDRVHHLKMSADAVIESQIFLSPFGSGSVIADTPIQLSSPFSLGAGTLTLGAESSLNLLDSGLIQFGSLNAGGDPVQIMGNGYLSNMTVDRGLIFGTTHLNGICSFTNGLTVNGGLQGSSWGMAEMSVEGLLVNEGVISGGSNSMDVIALGDVRNSGSMTNCTLTMNGNSDQFLGTGTEMDVDQLIINSGLQATGYQWFKNGTIIPGETDQNISFASVGPGIFAQYHCEAGDETSRTVTIDESLTATAAEGPSRLVTLEQNSPNPFNPITEISFSLEREGKVSIVIYDMAGREVQRLLETTMDAGRHSVTWQPRAVASGTYFYALKTGNTALFKKCILLK